MARQPKQGIEYFSVDVGMITDRKIRRIRKACGASAVAVILYLLSCIYSEKGYYIEVSDDLCFDIADEFKVDESLVRGVIESCAEYGFFDARIYAEFGILTSRRIQQNYIDATKRREGGEIDKRYLVTETASKNDINVCNKPDNVDNNPDDVCKSTQSKLNKSKVNKSKEDICAEQAPALPPVITLTLNDKSEYPISKEYIDEMASLYPGVDAMQEFRKMKAWCINNPTKRKTARGITRFINTWLTKAQDSGRASPQKPRESFERPVGNYDHLAVDPFADEKKGTIGKAKAFERPTENYDHLAVDLFADE